MNAIKGKNPPPVPDSDEGAVDGKGKKSGNGRLTPNPPAWNLPLSVNAQYLKDLSFESPGAPGIFKKLQQAPQIGVDVNVQNTPLPDFGENIHEVTLSMVITARSQDRTIFICELVYAGVFTLGDMPESIIETVLSVECPRILFPFIRAIICETTTNGGFPPLMINPIDFSTLYQKKITAKA